MKIRVADINEKPKTLAEVEAFSRFPSLVEAQEAGECEFRAPLAMELTVVREYDHLRVHGSVATRVGLTCSRCLTEYEGDVVSKFTIFYTKSAEAQPEDEVELGEEDLISVSYCGDEIDFSAEIAEQVLLEIPYKPLCMEDCLGLCPTCGVDRNTVPCSCSENKASMAFSSLKGLSVKR